MPTLIKIEEHVELTKPVVSVPVAVPEPPTPKVEEEEVN